LYHNPVSCLEALERGEPLDEERLKAETPEFADELHGFPGIIAMVGIYSACCDFTAMATAETPPKPVEVASVAGYSMSIAFIGLTSTIVPVLIGLCAFHKFTRTKLPDTDGGLNP
jgi:hypothetical protein